MRTLLRERIAGTTNAGTAVDLFAPQIRPGQAAYITHLALANSSGESVDVLFGITTMGDFTQLWAKQTVADSDAIGIELTLPLLEGDKLTARVTGTAKKAKVVFVAGGELRDAYPEVVEVIQAAPQAVASA